MQTVAVSHMSRSATIVPALLQAVLPIIIRVALTVPALLPVRLTTPALPARQTMAAGALRAVTVVTTTPTITIITTTAIVHTQLRVIARRREEADIRVEVQEAVLIVADVAENRSHDLNKYSHFQLHAYESYL